MALVAREAALSEFLLELYRQRDLAAFPHWLVQALGTLIGAEQVTWNELAPSLPWSRLVATPALEDPPAAERVFARHMLSHPCIRHVFATGDTRALKISDFLSPTQYHRTAIYRHLHSGLGIEDQLGVMLAPPAGETQALAIARSRRSFSENDRALLAALRAHIHQAYCNLRQLERARRALAQRDALSASLGLCLVPLDEAGRAQHYAPRAALWLERYFAEHGGAGTGRLPPSLAAWVGAARRRLSRGAPVAVQPLVRWRGGRRLTVRLLLEEGAGCSLLLEEQTQGPAAVPLQGLGLGRREIQVLQEVEAGRSNAEVAAALFISPRTVEKHLHNIYRKLGVCSRTAAVARMRAACSAEQ